IPHMFNESVATNVTVSIGIAPLADRNIGDAIEKADKALYEAKMGGEKIAGEGNYYAATVLADITPDMTAFRQELFGPVAAITVA
ncbi:aldehyde dehydrogenase family protein, partial [Salmonella enterica subsp. enterica serovar Montevideo]|nr:aldehyde dehydrogenase family protein [Salmonella enterica subsp. enterica serovar Montevideo]